MSSETVVAPEVAGEVASAGQQSTPFTQPSPSLQTAQQAAGESALVHWLTLTLLPGCGAGSIRKLVDYFGAPKAALAATKQQWMDVPGLSVKQLEGFDSIAECRQKAGSIVARAAALGVHVLCVDDAHYPELLLEIPDPPIVLYCLGNTQLLHSTCVAMVGSRSATGYGRRIARSFAEGVARAGVTVVSGMALGIDSESHLGALQAGGGTIGVLGCGIDVVYPRQNSALYQQVRSCGLLMSEYPPGTRPEGFRFPARNRIIAGLSRGVVVVEAARKSGSLITAQLGLDFGREIFAVPGQVDSYKSEGAHWLLQQGAQLVMGHGDILDVLTGGYHPSGAGPLGDGATEERPELPVELEPDALLLLNQLEPYPVSREEVAVKVDFSQARLSELFLYLELEGVIEMGPGDMVRRTI